MCAKVIGINFSVKSQILIEDKSIKQLYYWKSACNNVHLVCLLVCTNGKDKYNSFKLSNNKFTEHWMRNEAADQFNINESNKNKNEKLVEWPAAKQHLSGHTIDCCLEVWLGNWTKTNKQRVLPMFFLLTRAQQPKSTTTLLESQQQQQDPPLIASPSSLFIHSWASFFYLHSHSTMCTRLNAPSSSALMRRFGQLVVGTSTCDSWFMTTKYIGRNLSMWWWRRLRTKLLLTLIESLSIMTS